MTRYIHIARLLYAFAYLTIKKRCPPKRDCSSSLIKQAYNPDLHVSKRKLIRTHLV